MDTKASLVNVALFFPFQSLGDSTQLTASCNAQARVSQYCNCPASVNADFAYGIVSHDSSPSRVYPRSLSRPCYLHVSLLRQKTYLHTSRNFQFADLHTGNL